MLITEPSIAVSFQQDLDVPSTSSICHILLEKSSETREEGDSHARNKRCRWAGPVFHPLSEARIKYASVLSETFHFSTTQIITTSKIMV